LYTYERKELIRTDSSLYVNYKLINNLSNKSFEFSRKITLSFNSIEIHDIGSLGINLNLDTNLCKIEVVQGDSILFLTGYHSDNFVENDAIIKNDRILVKCVNNETIIKLKF
jgi:hypothetical protein